MNKSINSKELEKKDAVFNALSESKKTAFMIVTMDNRIVFLNKAMQEITGYTETELLSIPFDQLVHPDFINFFKKIIFSKNYNLSPAERYELKILCKDGTERWIDLSASHIDYEGEQSVFATAFDITEKKLAMAELEESAKKYRTILNEIEEGYFEVDAQGNFTFFNSSMCRILGYSHEKMLGMNYREYTSPETAKEMLSSYNRIYRTGESIHIKNYEVVSNQGNRVILELSSALIKNSKGSPVGFRGIVRDTTEKILAEQEKEKLKIQLYQALRMEAIGTLAGGIAHDFNNILASIQGYISILKLRTGPSHPIYEKLLRLDDLIQNGADLTRQLLGFAMGSKYEIKTLNVNAVITNSLKMIYSTKKKIRIVEEYQADIWNVEADQGQFEQALLNLYVNAVHAMTDGGELRLETSNIAIDQDTAGNLNLESGRYVKIIVADTGIGMDETTLQRIFEPFFTTKEMGRGTGLGLASTYGIIKNHNGKVFAASRKGEGSKFTIFLPASNKLQMIAEENNENEYQYGSETILLVDDEKTVIDVGTEILQELGYTVISASNGQQALSIFNEKKDEISLVLLDLVMPEISGAQIYQELKKINPKVRILLESGYNIDFQFEENLLDERDDFIQKPFNMKRLSQKIRKVLDKEIEI